jgi:type 1 glutamine amidotransferase
MNYFAHLKTGPRAPSKKHVLVLGGARKFQHDSISTAMASVFAWGESTDLWEGRVFASTLGHTREAFRAPDIARMYTEAIEWSLGLIDGPLPTPHPKR